jgi:hypothetical protein
VCSQGCTHFWAYKEGAARHLKNCRGCKECQCPHCHFERYILPAGGRDKIRDDESVQPASYCWFLYDVIHHKFMDATWAAAVNEAREKKLSSFHQTREDARLDRVLAENGFDPKKV